MKTQRIQVYAAPEMKRRIELAAAKVDLPVTEYCLQAIQQRLADDEVLEAAKVSIPVVASAPDSRLRDDLRALREAILNDRRGEPIDVTGFLEQTREERDEELLDLR